jgi:macrolide transport system ATP-binding/permease protein
LGALIEIVELHKTYQLGEVQVHALRGACFNVKRGEFIAIMGASGSGKSTMMNILGCLDRPTSGRYRLEGVEVNALSERELAALRSRRIGFIFQSFNLLSRTSALENVELPRFYSGLKSHAGEIAASLLNRVGLAGQELKHPNQLSGGQQQRVAVARALVNNPDILLADEPTGNLDSVNATEIMALLAALNRNQGLTLILVTHDPEVAAYADRVITFRDGLIISDRNNDALPDGRSTLAALKGEGAASAAGTSQQTASEYWPFVSMAIGTAIRALRRNKMRSVLTMLGIFIGVAAVIAMVAVGDGARASVKEKMQSLGTNLLVVLPGATTSNGVRAGVGSRSTLTVGDALAIRDEGAGIESVSYIDRQVAQVVSGNRNWNTGIDGTTTNYLSIRDWQVASGRRFNDEEVRAAAPVCLLGQTVVNNLFDPGQDPVGSIVRVRGFPLRVVGVLAMKGQSNYGHDLDDVVLIPFQTAERKVLGVSAPSPTSPATTVAFNPSAPSSPAPTSPVLNYSQIYDNAVVSPYASLLTNPFGNPPKILGVVNLIYAKVASDDQIQPAQTKVAEILHRRHHIIAGQEDDFTVRNLNEVAQASESASGVMALLLAAVASISLLVGGIGIMNIMLVSVTERTREIGIRMAIGARRLHILLQFLVEALLLSVVGGLMGVALGVTASRMISNFAGWPTLISPAAVAGGFLFSAAVGIFFGYYPARKAATLDPIDALRYE